MCVSIYVYICACVEECVYEDDEKNVCVCYEKYFTTDTLYLFLPRVRNGVKDTSKARAECPEQTSLHRQQRGTERPGISPALVGSEGKGSVCGVCEHAGQGKEECTVSEFVL
jgi:hypothetical protein